VDRGAEGGHFRWVMNQAKKTFFCERTGQENFGHAWVLPISSQATLVAAPEENEAASCSVDL